MKTINLTNEQVELLRVTLGNHEDMGPSGYGWKSGELEDLMEVIGQQVDAGGEREDKE